MEILQGFVDAVVGIFNSSGLTTLNWQNYVMIGISIVLLYLAIKKQYEPLLLLPIAFGMLLVNLYPSIMSAPSTEMIPLADYVKDHTGAIQYPITELNGAEYVNYPTYGGLLWYLYQGVKLGIYPPLIFLGIGCMTDFGHFKSKEPYPRCCGTDRYFCNIYRRYFPRLYSSRGRCYRYYRWC